MKENGKIRNDMEKENSFISQENCMVSEHTVSMSVEGVS